MKFLSDAVVVSRQIGGGAIFEQAERSLKIEEVGTTLMIILSGSAGTPRQSVQVLVLSS